MSDEKVDTQSPTPLLVARHHREGSETPHDAAENLDQLRQILFGDVFVEIERRFARLDSYIADRSSEVQQDARHRDDVLETHVRKELAASSERATHESSEVHELIRRVQGQQREAIDEIDRRLSRIEERLDGSIARIERETRQELLAQAKSTLEEIDRARSQLRAMIVRELDLGAERVEEGNLGADAGPISH